MSQPPAGGYPPPEPSQPGGYPPPANPGQPAGGYPPPAPGYQPPPGYTPPPTPGQGGLQQPPAPGYPPQAPAPGGYPPPVAGGYPPPAGGYPPAAQGYGPPAAYGAPGAPAYPPSGSPKPSFDASKVGTSDWIVIGAGLALLIFSFFGWYTISLGSFSGIDYGSISLGSWHEYWWLATVLGVAVAVIVALRAMMGQAISQVKPQFLMFAAAAGFLITLISLIEIIATEGAGPGVGIWVCLIVSAAQTYFVWLWAQKQPGWSLPKLPGPAL